MVLRERADPAWPKVPIAPVRMLVAFCTGTASATPDPITGKATELHACCSQSARARSSPQRNAYKNN